MSETGLSNCNADGLASTLFTNLTAGTSFALPAVDLTGATYQVPESTGNPLYTPVTRLTEADLTDRTVGGTGLFDGLLESISAHLKAQYDKGRITGTEYSSAYVALTQTAMSNAVQYLLNSESSYWQAQMAQKQAQAAEVQLVTERVNLETSKAQLATARTQSDLLEAQYALSKLTLSTEDAKYCLVQAQKAQTEAQTAHIGVETSTLLPAQIADIQASTTLKGTENDRAAYDLLNVLPSQVALTNAQKLQIDANASLTGAQEAGVTKETAIKTYQLDFLLPKELETGTARIANVEASTAQTVYENTFMLPAQLDRLTSETARIDYELLSIMPAELLRIQKQVDAISADISMSTAAKDKTLWETANLLPSQKTGIDADTDLKVYQLNNQLPAQVAGITEDTRGKAFSVDFMMPAQLELVREQMESNRAKTLDTRSDAVTPVTGAIGKQKDLHQQQIDSYKREAEHKVAKMLLDSWTVQKSMDEGLAPPTSLTDVNIDTVMGHVRTNLNLA